MLATTLPPRIIKRHDTRVMPRARLLDEYDQPIDLTGATVTYTLQDALSGVNKVTRASAFIDDQTSNLGEVFYQFAPADVDTVGFYSEQWEVVYATGEKETFPTGQTQTVRIEPDFDEM
jgi:hypothetical protein